MKRIIILWWNNNRPFVRVSRTPLDSRYFLKASFFASFSYQSHTMMVKTKSRRSTRKEMTLGHMRTVKEHWLEVYHTECNTDLFYSHYEGNANHIFDTNNFLILPKKLISMELRIRYKKHHILKTSYLRSMFSQQ